MNNYTKAEEYWLDKRVSYIFNDEKTKIPRSSLYRPPSRVYSRLGGFNNIGKKEEE